MDFPLSFWLKSRYFHLEERAGLGLLGALSKDVEARVDWRRGNEEFEQDPWGRRLWPLAQVGGKEKTGCS